MTAAISAKQNEPAQIQRLGAQRNLYAISKRAFGWQVFLGAPLAVASAIGALVLPEHKGWFAAWGLMVSLLDLFWLTPMQKRLRSEAAKIQEEFDCAVLELSWNEVKCGKKPDPETVREHSDAYAKWARKMKPLENWYAKCADRLPLHLGRLVCQRANCWWDSTQRRRYAGWIVRTVVVISIAIVAVAVITGQSLDGLILTAIVPMSPAWLLAMRQYFEQRETAERLDKLKDHCVSLWKSALAGASAVELSARCRELQDEIFESRRKAPPVLDFIFKQLRDDYEARMNHAAEHYVAEAQAALGIK